MNSGDSQITSRHHNLRIVFDRIHELYEQISSLPCGYVSRKTIKGKTRHYRQWRDKDGKVKGVYIKEPDYKAVVAGIERRRRLEGELAELEAYVQQSLRINTPEVRTFLIRYDRGKACRLSIEPDKGSQPIDCLPPCPIPKPIPSAFLLTGNPAGRCQAPRGPRHFGHRPDCRGNGAQPRRNSKTGTPHAYRTALPALPA